ncbi:metallophosphoesterase family protein [candidate division TA06 bacterium]|uniref:Metallophosphoesterase family protein n=1 Tax=candidate division TA06 bacterium TaxID=2250710 RepID=A0A933MKY3_UNCT6|nr:metallophosphoesterase family protein [candidate division TA06 bacterium]
MRYVIISDIHGNHQALSAVKASLEKEQPDEVICLGDIVGYGAEPGICLRETLELCHTVVAGNHDHGVAGRLETSFFSANARRAVEWTAGVLTPKEKKVLYDLPLMKEVFLPDISFIAVHSAPEQPQQWRYILSMDEAEYQFEHFSRPLCFIGHSHQPMFWRLGSDGECSVAGREYLRLEPGNRYIINAGSVGQPRDGDPRACYAVYDSQRRELIIRRVEYDIAAAQRDILKAGLPARLAERLAQGV